ncbi:hypothetical protein ERO13_A01G099500v2 [Gossypium hirsutum]|nr:hypothetical protein ERO13_A01G099500v2 [Gossypium hirsutum]
MVHNQAPHHRLIRYLRRPLKGHEDVEEERAWGVGRATRELGRTCKVEYVVIAGGCVRAAHGVA